MKADLITSMNKSAERIVMNINTVDDVKAEICDKCHLQYEEDLTQEQLDEKCENCIVELIKGFVF